MKHTPLQQDGSEQPQPKANADNNHVDKPCVFCEKIANESLVTYGEAVVFTPLNPVTPGHLLVVPTKHVSRLSEMTMDAKAHLFNALSIVTARLKEYNLINSYGINATQTVEHLHFHIVPRTKDDGLKLPWSEQQRTDLQPSDSEATTDTANAPTPVTLKKRNEA